MNASRSAALQMRSVKALLLRRLRTRYIGSRAGYTWALVEPICWVFILKFALAPHGGQLPPLGTSYEVFFTTGVVLARTWRSACGPIIQALCRAKMQGLPTLHRLDAAYATWIIEMTTGGVVMVIILSGLALWGFHAAPDDLLECIAAYAALSFFTISFAIALAVSILLFPALDHFKGLLMMAMFISSGFAMLIDRMPPTLRHIIEWNPLVHCIEWFREGFYPGYECMNLDKEYLLTVSIALLLYGLAGERALRRRGGVQTRLDEIGE